MSIILARLRPSTWSYGTSLACARHCRLDPSTTQHGAYVDEEGVFHYQHIDAASGTTTTLLRFQLQYRAAEGLSFEPVNKPWTFEFVPGCPGDLLLVQEGSCRILYASLPKQGTDSSDVFLFGSHTAPVCSVSTNGNVVFSSCQGGVLKLWRMSDGQLADTCSLPDKASVTAIASLGPLMVAVGSSSSTVTLYDITSGRLLAVQRLMSGPGAVQSMAAWVPPQVLAGANLAPGGPLASDGGGLLAGGAWSALRQSVEQDNSGSGPRALLAVASSSGWLCVFGADHASIPQPWSLIHSVGSLIAPGAKAQLAFSPDGASLAVASPAAQLLGTDAIALASMGASPGAVSLYHISSSGTGLSALLPPLLQQGQREQLPELLLWHQWSVSSTPAGLGMLPSSGFELMHGKQLQPAQVLHLYMVPQIGPAQVLKAQHKPPAPVWISKQRPGQEPTAIAYAAMAGRQSLEAAATSAAGHSSETVQYVSEIEHVQQEQQQQPDACANSSPRVPIVGASSSGRGVRDSSTSSSARRQEDADEALLLNIAERDLAEVAHAIAAAAGPTLDAELQALLAGASATATAAGAAHWGVDGSSTAETAGAAGPADKTAPSSQQQEQQQQGDPADAHAAMREPAAATTGSAALLGAADGAEADAAGGGSFRLPQTLPGVRSWGAWLGPASQHEARPDHSALAQALHEEQQRLRQQQQQQQQQAPEVHTVGAAAVAGTDSGAAVGAEPELPCESSFQHMLQPEQGSAAAQQQQRQQQQRHPRLQPLQQQQPRQLLQMLQQEDQVGSLGAADAAAEVSAPEVPAAVASAAAAEVCAAAATAAAAGVAVTAHDTAARALPAGAEQEPQPRQLPAMLRGSSSSIQRVPAAVVQNTSEACTSDFEGSSGAAGSSLSQTGMAVAGANRGQPLHRQHTSAGRQLDEVPASADWQQQQARQGLQQQQQDQVEQQARQGAAQQPPGRLSVQERLNLRRREVLAKQQAAQRFSAAVPAVFRGASSSAQVVRARQGAGAGAFAASNDHPLAAAAQNSSFLLAAKLQEAERAPDVTVDPAGPAAIKLAAARLADLDLSPEEQQYCYEELPDLKDVPTPTHAQKLVPKQLDAHWVASRSLKPCMDALFKPHEWQQTFVDPQVLLLPACPTPQQVVEQLLWPGQRPGVWT